MAKRGWRPPPEQREIYIDRNGERYVGAYTLQGGNVTVQYAGRHRTTQVGNVVDRAAAAMLLAELVAEAMQGRAVGGMSVAKKKSTSRTIKRASKQELIDRGRDKRFVRRGAGGKFKESDDTGKSLTVDRRKTAKKKAKRGQGDRGDR